MKTLLFFAFTLIYNMVFVSLASGKENKDYDAWLLMETESSQLKVIACAKNNSTVDVTLVLKLNLEKSGRAGKSSSNQSTPVFLKAGEEKCVSQMVLRLSPDDEYNISFEAYKNGRLIARDFYSTGKQK